MKQIQRQSTETDSKRDTAPEERPPATPKLAPIAAGGVPVRAPDALLYGNELFGVTQEGLVLRPTGQLLIPRAHLLLVGNVARSIPAKHSGNPFMVALHSGNPFMVALHYALMIHIPSEFPDGLN